MLWLTLIPIFVAYMIVAARLQPLFAQIDAAKCYNCNQGKPYYYSAVNRDVEPGYDHGGLAALLWPITAPYILVNAKYNPEIKRGRNRIAAYWENKEIEERRNQLNDLERRAGIGQ